MIWLRRTAARVVRLLVDAWELTLEGALAADGLTAQDESRAERGKAAQDRVVADSGFVLGILRAAGEAELKRVIEESDASRGYIDRCLAVVEGTGGGVPLVESRFNLLRRARISSECVGGLMRSGWPFLSVPSGRMTR